MAVDDLIVHERPDLRAPRMVVAFGGWPDAAGVATRAVQTLVEQLGGTRFAEIPSEDFYSLAVIRPTTKIRDGRIESLAYPSTEFHYWRNPSTSGDLILLAGLEPHLQWRRYVEAILTLAADTGVTTLFALGGLYDSVSHTRPVRVSGVVEDADLRAKLGKLGFALTDYEGPSSLHTTLLVECRARGIAAASLWGHVPSYAQLSWNPRVSAGLLKPLVELLGIEVDLAPLQTAATFLDQALDRLARQNPQIRALISRLEESYGAAEETTSSPGPISKNILREVEEILRRGEGTPDEGDSSGDQPEV
jgi:proteasome assembly chaperone (PAC2) family protein